MGKKSKNKQKKAKANATNENHDLPPRPPPEIKPPTPPLKPEQIQKLNSYVDIEKTMDAILSRGVSNSREGLREYLMKLVSELQFHAITLPLLRGLCWGPPYIHKKVKLYEHQEEPLPFLVWACQWKWLRYNGYWPAESELVDMVLKAGAASQVNHPLNNKTNPLFFAVKYGDLKTVDLLLKAGINIHQRDKYDQTCFSNALEHPQPPIIERLLDYMPTTETYIINSIESDGSSYHATAADLFIHRIQEQKLLVSWANMGPPSPESLSEALMLMRRKGARFSSEGSTRAFQYLGGLFRSDVTLDASQLNAPENFRELARSLVGENIPEVFRPPKSSEDEADHGKESGGPCPICSKNPRKKSITLYCGHSFCLNCIIDHGKQTDGTCPVCGALLCHDLHMPQVGECIPLRHCLGIKFNPELIPLAHLRLADNQVIEEAKFQGIHNDAADVDSLRSALQEDINQRATSLKVSTNDVSDQDTKLTLDLLAADTMVGNGTGLLHPTHGRVCIEISIRDVPLLAYVGNRHMLTMVSKSVAEQLRLTRIESLQSKKFVSTLNGKKQSGLKFTCLETFTVMVGGIEVDLSNAVEVDPDPFPLFGIQLGGDFLSSGIWCPIDVETSMGVVRVDRDFSWLVKNKTKEMLRYYAYDGRTAHLPLLHFDPFGRNAFPGISLKSSVKFDVCYWCCRAFPEGMLGCNTCLQQSCPDDGKIALYCDSRCLNAAWKIHKKTLCMGNLVD